MAIPRKRHEVVQPEDHRLIALTHGRVAKVDIDDYDALSKWHWHLTPGGYAARRDASLEKPILALMHRTIMGAGRHQILDHINRDPLDNRKANLRFCSKRQNGCNAKARKKPKTSAYKGVFFVQQCQRWVASVKTDAKKVLRRFFRSEREAALAYNELARRYYGEFAALNDV